MNTLQHHTIPKRLVEDFGENLRTYLNSKVLRCKMDKFRPPESYLKNTTQTIVVVDYSNLLYRAWFVSSKRIFVAYCKFFDMLRLCIKRSKQKGVPLKLVFAGESRTQLDRATVFDGYKGTRMPNTDGKFTAFRKGLAELLKFIGWDIICVDGKEADDVMASIVATYCRKSTKVPCPTEYTTDVVIFSGDRDLQQCLAWDRTFIYRAPGLFVTKESFEDENLMPVHKFGIYKALIGDKGDNIKGVEGFGPAKALIAINANSVSTDIWEMSGPKGAEEFRLAYKLVKLDDRIKINIDDIYTGYPIFDDVIFKKKYDDKVLLELKRLKEEF